MAERSTTNLSGHRFIATESFHPHEGKHSGGQWSHKVTSDWQSRSMSQPEGFGSLSAALDHIDPPVTYQNGHLPHEVPPVPDPRGSFSTTSLDSRVPQARGILESYVRQGN